MTHNIVAYKLPDLLPVSKRYDLKCFAEAVQRREYLKVRPVQVKGLMNILIGRTLGSTAIFETAPCDSVTRQLKFYNISFRKDLQVPAV